MSKNKATDNIVTIGIDIAKNVFQLHGIDAAGKILLRKVVKRAEFLCFMGRISPCLIVVTVT